MNVVRDADGAEMMKSKSGKRNKRIKKFSLCSETIERAVQRKLR